MEEVPNFFSEGLVPYELDGRYICLGVQLHETTPGTMVNKPLCFLPPGFSGLYKDPLKDEWAVQSPDIPPGVFIQE